MDLVKLTSTLIEFESVSYQEMPLVRWLARTLDACDISYEFDEFNPGEFLGDRGVYPETANIYVDIGHGSDALMLYAHTDVVSGKRDQFRPTIKDGWLYGRGAADMKSSLAGLIATLITNYDQIASSGRRVIFGFIADEETSGTGARRSVRWLTKQGIERLGVVLAEPSENFSEITVGGKGYIFIDVEGNFSSTIALLREILAKRPSLLSKYTSINLDFGDPYVTLTSLKCPIVGDIDYQTTVMGKAAHASRPEHGENALEKLLLVMSEEINFMTTGENSPNTIPDYCVAGVTRGLAPLHCQATIDVRTTPEADYNDALLNDLQALFAHHPNCSHRIRDRGKAYRTQSQELLNICLRSVRPTPKPTIALGGSDAGYFTELTSEIIGGFGPGEQRYLHTDDERVSVAALQSALPTFSNVITGFLDKS